MVISDGLKKPQPFREENNTTFGLIFLLEQISLHDYKVLFKGLENSDQDQDQV